MLSLRTPFTKNIFDAAICGGILHHLPDKSDLKTVINNLSACLDRNGKIVLVEPNGSNPIVNISRRLGRFLVRRYSSNIASENETMHLIKTYSNILEENKFEILLVESWYHDTSGRIKNEDRVMNVLTKIRRILFKIAWKILPEPYRGNEIIIIAKLNTKK